MTTESIGLADGRRLTVCLPPGFRARPRRPYPVLILHDGQNLFDDGRAWVRGQHWRVRETARRLILRRAIPPVVIAGVDHAGPGRVREFTPTPGPRREGGGAGRYVRLIAEEVLPLLRRRWAVSGDRRDTMIGGSSMGGLVTLVAAVARPRTFGGLLVMSPSVWWDRRHVLGLIRRRPGAFRGSRVWLDVGTDEGEPAVADARRLRDLLAAVHETNRGDGPVVSYVEDPAGDHSERSWARRLPKALRFLFGAPRHRTAIRRA